MRFKRTLAVLSIFTAGVLLGAGGGIAYSGWLTAHSLLLLKTIELYRSGEAAFSAYKSQSPETGAWALEQHLKLIEELEKVGVPKAKLNCDAFFAHVRLARLLEVLGKRDKMKEHIRYALNLAGPAGFPAITSEQALWDALRTSDDRGIH